MDCYGHKLSNGVLFAHHLILDVPGGSSHLAYRRRVGVSHNPPTRVKERFGFGVCSGILLGADSREEHRDANIFLNFKLL